MSRLKIVSVAQYSKAVWQVGMGIPSICIDPANKSYGSQIGSVDGTQIDNIILLGGNIEIFGRDVSAPGRGFHKTLCTPTVSLLTAMANRPEWEALLHEVDTRETVEEVLDGLDNVWKINNDVPNQPDYTIVRMAMLDDSVEVFVAPKVGTRLDKVGFCLHFRLMPFFIQSISATADLNNWTALQAEYAEMAEAEENGDDEDDDDDELLDPSEELETAPGALGQPVAAAVPPPPPPPPAPMNGAAPTATTPEQ